MSLASSSIFASPLPDFPFVTVTGTSSAKVQPNVAKISFNLTTFDAESEVASNHLQDVTTSVLEVFEHYKIASDDIVAYEITKNIRRERDKNYNSLAILGYDFSRNFTVTIKSLNDYPKIVNALRKIDNLHNLNTEFDATNRSEVEVTLIAQAAENAKNKAQQMASGLGVELGEVFAFNDTGSFNSFFATFGLENSPGHATLSAPMEYRGKGGNESDIFIPQSIEVSKTINVVYRINSFIKWQQD